MAASGEEEGEEGVSADAMAIFAKIRDLCDVFAVNGLNEPVAIVLPSLSDGLAFNALIRQQFNLAIVNLPAPNGENWYETTIAGVSVRWPAR